MAVLKQMKARLDKVKGGVHEHRGLVSLAISASAVAAAASYLREEHVLPYAGVKLQMQLLGDAASPEWWLLAPALLMGAWWLVLAIATLVRPTKGKWEGGAFVSGEYSRGAAGALTFLAVGYALAVQPELPQTLPADNAGAAAAAAAGYCPSCPDVLYQSRC